ncbi:tight adherence protein D [Enterobacter asburiae]|uniref:tetratricopeptide repeat protein n=1 Tax=Enterobacter asburiae TaxID=61645 RepID=UPI001DC50ABD|nr:tetratricopeptide repeat protein [Enterobacter asburiae]NIH92219.1 tight adherence protein D [Enterobacter asburiae]
MASFKRNTIILLCLLTLSGCVAPLHKNSASLTAKENILLKSKNYAGLISLYRDSLKHRDDPEIRVKLSRSYYEAGDYPSSLLYLQPIAASANPEVYALQAKNMIALGEHERALKAVDRMLQLDPQSAEAFNLRGIAQALSGNLQSGAQSLQKSRELFIADDIAINNLAVVALLDRRYKDAVSLLLPQYLRGQRQPRQLHNLVLALVKVGDIRYAREIIQNEKLSPNPDDIIDALSQIHPLKEGIV